LRAPRAERSAIGGNQEKRSLGEIGPADDVLNAIEKNRGVLFETARGNEETTTGHFKHAVLDPFPCMLVSE
jgi:hypothetical protein